MLAAMLDRVEMIDHAGRDFAYRLIPAESQR
jgi:hypothetical protein